MAEKKKCSNCQRERPLKEFWKSNNLEMYPGDGKVDLCRLCLTKGVKDLNDWAGVREICKVLDYPFIQSKWDDVVKKMRENAERYDISTEKKKRETIRKTIGDYARIMKLGKYMKMTYEDSDEIVTLVADATDIAVEQKRKEKEQELEEVREASMGSFSIEERAFLMAKWRTTDLEDMLWLENYYLSMMEDFEITTTSHKDYLRKICKISLNLDKAIEANDGDNIKILRATYSAFMKEGNFTEQQANKDKSNFVSSFGELAAFLEVEGFVEMIDLTFPRDMVDRTIGNLNSYIRDLVLNESGLADLLESTIQLMNAPDEDEDADYEYGSDYMWEDDLEIDWSKIDEEEEDEVDEEVKEKVEGEKKDE